LSVTIRRLNAEDADACGAICYEAFREIGEAHGFAPDIPSVEAGIALVRGKTKQSAWYGVVAEVDGRVVGSCFLDERSLPVVGIGPITVDPAAQNGSVGRRLMGAMLDRAKEIGAEGVRLVQAGYHMRSLALYTKLGFAPREPLACLSGASPRFSTPGYAVRAASEADVAACNAVCVAVHGHDRGIELGDAIRAGSATLVERDGRVTGYATRIGFSGHAVGETNEDLKALIVAAHAYQGPGFLVPTRNAELFRWCLENGLRIVQPMTLMTIGRYDEPKGAFLPSVTF
jgi:predicted N-acetyltransferase YhbS